MKLFYVRMIAIWYFAYISLFFSIHVLLLDDICSDEETLKSLAFADTHPQRSNFSVTFIIAHFSQMSDMT